MCPLPGVVPEPSRRPSGRLVLAVAACCAAFLGLCGSIREFTVDDAYISFRYAAHLASGHGLAWNPGEAPLEGFTNLLYTLALAVPARFGLDLVAASKVIGILFGLATIPLVALRVARWTGSEVAAVAAALLLGIDPRLATHAVAGLETPIYTFLVVAVALSTAERLRTGRPGVAVPLALSSVAVLLRPEGALLGLLALALLVALRPADRTRRTVAVSLATFFGPLALFLAWKTLYFGSLLPNTVLVKTSGEMLHAATAWQIAYFYLWWTLPLVALSCVALRRARSLRPPLLALLAIATALVFGYLPAKLIMGYKFRFFAPVYPLLVAAAAVGLASLAGLRDPRAAPRRRAVAALAVAAFLLYPIKDAPDTIEDARAYAAGLRAAHVRIGRSLAEWRPSGLLFVSGDAGAVPYYSGWRAIDGAGLNDTYLARRGSFDPEYVFSQAPDVLVLTSDFRNRVDHAVSTEVARDPRFAEYSLVASLDFLGYERKLADLSYRDPAPGRGYWEQVWVHRRVDPERVGLLQRRLGVRRGAP